MPQGTLRAVSLSLRVRAAHDTPLAGSKQVSCRACSFAANVILSSWGRCSVIASSVSEVAMA